MLQVIKKMPSGNQITKQELTEAMKRIKKSDLSGVQIVFFIIFMYFSGTIAFFYFTKVNLPLWADWFVSILNVPIIFIVVRFTKVKFLKARAKGLLGIKRCASCGYSLQELIADDDGCTICPECGAAWKLECKIPQ